MGNSGLKQHYETASKTGVLQISGHKLKEIPAEVFDLSENLRSLDLSKNKISEIPKDISLLKLLKQLNLSSNNIQILPASLCNLKKLELLDLTCNSISELPHSLKNLTNLKKIYLRKNKFTTFPMELLGIQSLEVIDLSDNKLLEIPSGMSNLYVTDLDLSDNQISTLSEDLHLAPKLKILRLEDNCLSLNAFLPSLLRDSKIHTFGVDGNLFEEKKFASVEGYNEFIERYTAMKKKMF